MTTAYVYKWTHIPTLMWYIGSRTAWNKGLSGDVRCKRSDDTKSAIGLSRTGKTWNEKVKAKISLSEKRTKQSIKFDKNQNLKGESIC